MTRNYNQHVKSMKVKLIKKGWEKSWMDAEDEDNIDRIGNRFYFWCMWRDYDIFQFISYMLLDYIAYFRELNIRSKQSTAPNCFLRIGICLNYQSSTSPNRCSISRFDSCWCLQSSISYSLFFWFCILTSSIQLLLQINLSKHYFS